MKGVGHGYPFPTKNHNNVLDGFSATPDRLHKILSGEENFDFVVIGSGFCGLAFVDRVLKRDYPNHFKPRILLLESGSLVLAEHLQSSCLPLRWVEARGEQLSSFPWTLRRGASSVWLEGEQLYLGGKSGVWSGWCPRPDATKGELEGWPQYLTDMLTDPFFQTAEDLLGVTPANQIDTDTPGQHKIYHKVQEKGYQLLLEHQEGIPGINRVLPAPISLKPKSSRMDFSKFSVVGSLLELASDFTENLVIVSGCSVERLIHQDGEVTALKSSRGSIPVGDHTEVVLAMGCLPTATLMKNSFKFPDLEIGTKFGANFVSTTVARIPLDAFHDEEELLELNALEFGAVYLSGVGSNAKTFHLQVTLIRNNNPEAHKSTFLRFLPDIGAMLTPEQQSEGHVVVVVVAYGEMEIEGNSFQEYEGVEDRTANCILKMKLNERDMALWNEMDESAYQAIQVLNNGKTDHVEYWKDGKWVQERSNVHMDSLVNGSSVLNWGDCMEEKFRPIGTQKLHITGSSFWPTAASWNPTLTMCGFAQKLADMLSDRFINIPVIVLESIPTTKPNLHENVIVIETDPAPEPETFVVVVPDSKDQEIEELDVTITSSFKIEVNDTEEPQEVVVSPLSPAVSEDPVSPPIEDPISAPPTVSEDPISPATIPTTPSPKPQPSTPNTMSTTKKRAKKGKRRNK